MTKSLNNPNYDLLEREGLSLEEITRSLDGAVMLSMDEQISGDYVSTAYSWINNGVAFDVAWDHEKKGVYAARVQYRNQLVGLVSESHDIKQLYGLAKEKYDASFSEITQADAITAARSRLNIKRRRSDE
ncbi:hypothetical protein GOV11_03460 [Candidatus Woesearchaeota archaeon]|nr:hypothetical protein [Candidatus Woesearchaeota archaeon]